MRIPQAFVPVDQVAVDGADPAAGAEVSVVVPAGELWELLAVTVALVQGLTNTPQPVLVVDDGATERFSALGNAVAQSASTTARYTWAVGLMPTGFIGTTPNIRAYAPLLPNLLLAESWRVRTVTLGIAATADYGVPSLLVRKRAAFVS